MAQYRARLSPSTLYEVNTRHKRAFPAPRHNLVLIGCATAPVARARVVALARKAVIPARTVGFVHCREPRCRLGYWCAIPPRSGGEKKESRDSYAWGTYPVIGRAGAQQSPYECFVQATLEGARSRPRSDVNERGTGRLYEYPHWDLREVCVQHGS